MLVCSCMAVNVDGAYSTESMPRSHYSLNFPLVALLELEQELH